MGGQQYGVAMTPTGMPDSEWLERLVSEARVLAAGSIAVRHARAELRQSDDDGTYVLVSLDLTPPADGAESWPLEEFHAFRQLARHRLSLVAAPLEAHVAYVGGELETPGEAIG